jgi:long-chain acyl-CoA synthetase
VEDSDPAVILYTSGTTARPKGVTHNHHSTRSAAMATIEAGYRSNDVLLSFCPLAHVSGLMLLLVPAVLLAAECALVPRFDAAEVMETLERRRCTATFGLPVMLQAMCREQEVHPRDAGTLRMCIAGGDTVPLPLQQEFQRLFGCAIQQGIGMTECVPICITRPTRVRPGSIGEPALDVQARIVDGAGLPVPPGEVGELIYRAPSMMVGYWNDPVATAATVRGGWLYSGDLARQDADGWYWFAGRSKEIIVRGGSNVAPQEVEEVLLQHPAVFQAGVVGVPDAEQGESVIAFVCLRESRGCNELELLDFARRHLSEHKVPGRVHFLEALPLGNTGKVSRRSLRDSLLPAPQRTGRSTICPTAVFEAGT